MSTLVQLDLSPVAPDQQPSAILQAFADLPAGQSLEWTQTQDPLPLQHQLLTLWPGQFAWARQEQEGERWTLRLTRKPAGKSCCGCCGG